MTIVFWPLIVAAIVLGLLWLLWLALGLVPAARDRYDHWVRLHLHGELHFFHVHLVLALILALVLGPLLLVAAYEVGYQTATRYDAQYFRTHYRFPGLRPPRTRLPAPLATPPLRAVPATAAINIARYPGVGDQGTTGACAAWSTAWALSYEWRMTHPLSGLRFSPRCLYDEYVCATYGCADGGSTFDGDVARMGSAGDARYRQVPYGTSAPNAIPSLAPYGTEQPPSACYILGAPYQEPVAVHDLTGYFYAPGQAAIDLMRQTIAGAGTIDGKAHPVLIGLPVYPEYDNATIQPLIVSPHTDAQSNPTEQSRGGHANVILAYDDTRLMPDGTVGAALVQNQWGARWGAQGRAWLSYDFIRKWAFGLSYLTVGAAALKAGQKHGAPPKFLPNPAPPRPAPTAPAGQPTLGLASSSWYVHSVPGYEGSRVIDLAPIINRLGDKMHVWPVGIAATIYTESSGNVYAERWAGGLDNSCGLMQQIITNIAIYVGISDPRAACTWEENPANSIQLGAKMLADCAAYHGSRVPWPNQYVFYNGGCGLSDSVAFNPYGDLLAHFEGFLRSYNYALTYFAGGAPPGHTAFPAAKWRAWCSTHPHKACQSYRYRGHVSWAGSVWLTAEGLGGVKGAERYYQPRHGRGYTKTNFQRGAIYTWPAYHAVKVVDRRGRIVCRGRCT